MAIGNFKETSESNEVNETRENNDNTEKARNQILEMPEKYDDDFDSKLDSYEREGNEGQEKGDESGGEKNSFFEKMKNLFSRKESGEETEENNDSGTESEADDSSKRSGFAEDLKKDVLSMEEQAENAKDLPGREDYLNAREKSEQAKQDYPDLKNWELSPEQLAEVRQGQSEVADKYADKGNERSEASDDEGRIPGGDAWERRFGNVEEND